MRTIYILFQQIKDEFQDYDNSGQFRSLQVQSYPVLTVTFHPLAYQAYFIHPKFNCAFST